jgi:hypothetical protein
MIKRAFLAVAGFVGLCVSLSVQQARGAEQLQLDGISLDRSSLQPPSISLEDRESFFFSTSFGWMEPRADFLPTFNPVQPQGAASPNMSRRRDAVDEVVDLRSPDRIHVGGEVGFLYGRSSGKYGREFELGYVIGELGNDKFHLTVGTSYENSSGRIPRWGR